MFAEMMSLVLGGMSLGEFVVGAVALSVLEVVLGVDNLIMLTIMVNKCPVAQRKMLRQFGLSFAMVTRIGLLFSLSWLTQLKEVLFTVGGHGFSGRDLVLLGGGLFLLYKASQEIYEMVEGHGEAARAEAAIQDAVAKLGWEALARVIVTIGVMDLVFSLDSVITAVGMTSNLYVMVFAVVIAMVMMQFGAGPIGDFVERHPGMKLLALAFLLLIGVVLSLEGLGGHVDKKVVYGAMGFGFAVQLLAVRMHSKQRKAEPLNTAATNG